MKPVTPKKRRNFSKMSLTQRRRFYRRIVKCCRELDSLTRIASR